MAAARIALAALLLLFAAAGTARGGPATTNSDGDVLGFSIGVTPPQTGTAKAPQGVALSMDAFAGNRIVANRAIPTDSLTFVLPRGFVDNGLQFPACRITPNAISPCAPATQIGSGSAETELLNPANQPPTFTAARLAVYNGKPLLGTVPTLIMITRVAGRPAGELDFVVRPSPHGLTVSQILVPSSGPGIGITKVSLSIPDRHTTVRFKGKAATVHLLQAPLTCSRAWTFALTTTSAGRKPLTATDSEPCVQR